MTPFLPKKNLLSYLEAILRKYNAACRRDNVSKARLKILFEAMGIEAFSDTVNMEWVGIRDSVVELLSAEF